MMESAEKSRVVLALESRIITEEQAMTPEQRTERLARLEREAERHGAFTRVW